MVDLNNKTKPPGLVVIPATARAKGKAKSSPSSYESSDRLYTNEEILEETKRLYGQLADEDLAEKFQAYLKTLGKNNDRYVLKHPNFLDALFASFANSQSSSYDEEQGKRNIEGKQGRVLAKQGYIAFEPERKLVGKSKIRETRFTMENAYEMAFAAMLDQNFMPPNKFKIANANKVQRAMIQIALRHVQRECLPEGTKFKIANPLSVVELSRIRASHGIRDNYNKVMFRAAERRREAAKVESAANADDNDNTPRKKEIVSVDEQYKIAKNLLLNNPKDYEGSVTVFAKDLAEKIGKDNLDPKTMKAIIKQLKDDGIIELDQTTAIHQISKVAQPQLHDSDYSKVVANMIHKSDRWFAKDGSASKGREDVAKFLFGPKELTDSQKAKVDKIWNTLQAEKIITLDAQGKIEKIAKQFAGTDIGDAFTKMAKGPVTLQRLMANTKRQILVGTEASGARTIARGITKAADKIADEATARATGLAFKKAVGPFPKGVKGNWQNTPAADPDFGKVAKSIIKHPDDWADANGKGKQRKHVAEALFGKTSGLTPEENKHLIKIWGALKDTGVVTVDKGKIVDVAKAFDARTLGGQFIRAAKPKADKGKTLENAGRAFVRIVPFLKIEDTPASRLS